MWMCWMDCIVNIEWNGVWIWGSYLRWVCAWNGFESVWMDSRVWWDCNEMVWIVWKCVLVFVEVCKVWMENCKMSVDELCFLSKEW